MFENPTIEAVPSGLGRIIIPAFGFAGGTATERSEGGVQKEINGLIFHNPKDDSTQVLKAKDGVLICYDAPGRKEKIEKYLSDNPKTFQTADGIKKFIDYLCIYVVTDDEKADLWDSNINFAAGLDGAPDMGDIKPGGIFVGVKKKEIVQAVSVPKGSQFEGAEGNTQTAGETGAYLIKDSSGIRMIQKAEFFKERRRSFPYEQRQ